MPEQNSLGKYWPILAAVVLGVALMSAIANQRPRHGMAGETATAPTSAPADVPQH